MEYSTHTFAENHYNYWYVTNYGEVYRLSKRTGKRFQLKPYIHKKSVVIKANYKTYVLNVLMMKSFNPRLRRKRFHVRHKNEDRFDFRLSNLYVVSYQQHGKETGHMSKSKPVKVKVIGQSGFTQYRSVRAAAKELHVSYQTLLDYMNPKTKPKHSVLSKYRILYAKKRRNHGQISREISTRRKDAT